MYFYHNLKALTFQLPPDLLINQFYIHVLYINIGKWTRIILCIKSFITSICIKLMIFFKGYARVSNVEFKKTGQDGFTASYDPRFSISFLEIGDVSAPTAIKPCYVKKCSFHHGYGTAIGVFGTHGLEIQDNVIHRTVGACKFINL